MRIAPVAAALTLVLVGPLSLLQAQPRGGNPPAASHAAPGSRGTAAAAPHVPSNPLAPRDAPAFRPHYTFRPRVRVGGGVWAGYPVVYPYLDASAPGDDVSANSPAAPPAASSDALSVASSAPRSVYLDVQPSTAQVYVDGFYVGTVDDFDAFGTVISPGVHQIDLRADDYEPLTVPIAVAEGHTTSYRETMKVLPGTATAARAVARSTAQMYSIPGCYLGNVPPEPDSLPAGCDARDVRTLERQSR